MEKREELSLVGEGRRKVSFGKLLTWMQRPHPGNLLEEGGFMTIYGKFSSNRRSP